MLKGAEEKHKAARYNNVTQPVIRVTVRSHYNRNAFYFKTPQEMFIMWCDDTSSGSCVMNDL